MLHCDFITFLSFMINKYYCCSLRAKSRPCYRVT